MKANFYMSNRKLELLKQAIDEMNEGAFSISIDNVHEDFVYPESCWVSLTYRSVDDLFYLGCFLGRIEASTYFVK